MKNRPLLTIKVNAGNIFVRIRFNLSVRVYRSYLTHCEVICGLKMSQAGLCLFGRRHSQHSEPRGRQSLPCKYWLVHRQGG